MSESKWYVTILPCADLQILQTVQTTGGPILLGTQIKAKGKISNLIRFIFVVLLLISGITMLVLN